MKNWFMWRAIPMRLHQHHPRKQLQRSLHLTAPSHACAQQGGTALAEPAGSPLSWEARFPEGEKHGGETCWWALLSSFLVCWSGLNMLNTFFFFLCDSEKEALSTSYLSSSSLTSTSVSLLPEENKNTPIAYP